MAEREISLNSERKPQKEIKVTKVEEPKLNLKVQTAGSSLTEVLDLILTKSPDEFLPWEEITLPSGGKFYGDRMPEGKIKIRPMSLVTDKIMATDRFIQSGQVLEKIFQKCIKFPDPTFATTDLLNGDRVCILFYLRGITHGPEYEFSMVCSNESCKHLGTYNYNLNNVQNNITHPTYDHEPVKLSLPYLSEITGKDFYVEMRYMREADAVQVAQMKKNRERMMPSVVRSKNMPVQQLSDDQLDNYIEDQMSVCMVSVCGVKDPQKKIALIKRLHARDSSVIREFLSDNPGIDTTIEIKCVACGQEMKTGLPITDTFFRPTKSERT